MGDQGFTYNQDNRLIQASLRGAVVGEYTYNGKGERTKKTADGKTTLYIYDKDGSLISEADETGAIVQRVCVPRRETPLAHFERAPQGCGGEGLDQQGKEAFQHQCLCLHPGRGLHREVGKDRQPGSGGLPERACSPTAITSSGRTISPTSSGRRSSVCREGMRPIS